LKKWHRTESPEEAKLEEVWRTARGLPKFAKLRRGTWNPKTFLKIINLRRKEHGNWATRAEGETKFIKNTMQREKAESI